MLDRNGESKSISNPEPFYTFLNFFEALEFEHKMDNEYHDEYYINTACA